jgi:hypothetical protein
VLQATPGPQSAFEIQKLFGALAHIPATQCTPPPQSVSARQEPSYADAERGNSARKAKTKNELIILIFILSLPLFFHCVNVFFACVCNIAVALTGFHVLHRMNDAALSALCNSRTKSVLFLNLR